MPLNNREVAFLAWIALGIAIALWKTKPKRALLLHLLGALLARKIVAFQFLLVCWVGSTVLAFYSLGWWGWSNLKTTLEWSATFGFAAFAQISHRENESILRRQLTESLNVVVVVAFISSAYVFDLYIELVLTFFIILFSLVFAISEKDSRLRLVSNISSALF